MKKGQQGYPDMFALYPSDVLIIRERKIFFPLNKAQFLSVKMKN
jgi:hypothetical protein